MQRPPLLLLVLLLAVSLPAGTVGVRGTLPGDAAAPAAVPEPEVGAEQASVAALRAGAVSGPPVASASASRTQASFDRNRVVLTVYENGSARWTFHYRRTLGNRTERRDFQSFAEEFNRNRTRLYRQFKRDSTGLTREGANVTGREMNATGFAREAYVTNTTFGRPVGVVEMTFVWVGFGVERGDRVVVGDVFEGGLYLASQQTLVVSPGPNLSFRAVDPEGTPSNVSSLRNSDSMTWQGEKEFTDNRPRVVLARPESDEGTDAGATATPSNGTTRNDAAGTTGSGSVESTPDPGASLGGGLPLVPLSLGALLVAVAIAALWYREEDDGPPPAPPSDGSDPDPGGGPAADAPPAGAEPTPAVDAEDGGGAVGSEPPTVTEDELLSDEDRVMSLIREQGGRMKQVNIVDRTGWSKSKVSMLLSDMEEEGQISKLRVGRENVISLEGHEPDAAESPFGAGEQSEPNRRS